MDEDGTRQEPQDSTTDHEKGSTPPGGENPPALELITDAAPHNGRPAYRKKCVVDGVPRMLGGQLLMLFLAMTNLFVVYIVGRRVGKSTGGQFLCLEEQPLIKGRYNHGYIAQDHPKATEAQENFITAMGGDPKHNKNSMLTRVKRSQGQDRFCEIGPMVQVLPDGTQVDHGNTGGRYYFFSGTAPHYKSIKGFMFAFHRFHLDEAPMTEQACVTQVVIPMLMDSGGSLLITGTPDANAIGNAWVQRYYNWGLSSLRPHWVCANFPSEANPLITIENVQISRSTCLTRAEEQQEYDAVFLDDMGGVFDHLDEAFCLNASKVPPDWLKNMMNAHPCPGMTAWVHRSPKIGHKYVMGADWARTADSTVFSIFDVGTGDQAALFHLRNAEFDLQVQWARLLCESYNFAHIHADASPIGMAMTEHLANIYKQGVFKHVFTSSSKQGYVRRAQMLFKTASWRLINCTEQKEQFRIYRAELLKSGHVRYDHPEGEHDDFIDAAMMVGEPLALPRQAKKPTREAVKPYSHEWFMQETNKRRRQDKVRATQIR